MAARNLSPVRALVRELVPIVGSFAPNAGSAVDAASRKGLGFTVARTSQGLFTLTFTDSYADVVAATAHAQTVTAQDRMAQIGVYTPASKTLQIRVVDTAGAVQDIAADANSRIHFTIWFRNSAATPVRGG